MHICIYIFTALAAMPQNTARVLVFVEFSYDDDDDDNDEMKKRQILINLKLAK